MTSSASVQVPRRSVLRTGSGLAVAAGLATAAGPARAAGPGAGPASGPASGPGAPGAQRAGRTSANGWPVEDAADDGGAVWTVPVPGSPLSVALRIGAVSTVLVHVLRRYHYEIDALAAGEVTGFRPLSGTLRGHTTDHASGTAVAIRPGWFPPGVRGGLLAHHVDVVRDVLAEAQGVVAWGADCPVPDESRFHIAVPPADPRLKRLADRVRGWADVPGAGAGTRVVGS